MARQSDRGRLEQISDYVAQHPGVKPADIARQLEVPRSSVTRALPALEEEGYLLYEDRKGGLWPFRK